MSGIVILTVSIVAFVVAYFTYGSYLFKQWGVDSKRVTPAHEKNDGIDYIPAKAPVLLGHHFASIAGAGPINGPIQAAIFGWVPVFLWIVLGGIFFGAVQDFSAILVSLRHGGKSLGEVIEEHIGYRCKILFTSFCWVVLLLVIAAFSDIVASTFNGFTAEGEKVIANGSVATASVLFIPLSIVFGFLVHRKNANLAFSTIIGVLVLIACIYLGLKFPIFFGKNFWLIFIYGYILIASVTPVWILLQPRDYLNSFLLYFMIIAAVIGIFGSNPIVSAPSFTGFFNSFNGAALFPFLFITVACGAISGFHSLIGSGTTSKQIDNEKDAKLIGYGGMLIECVLAIIALITVATLFKNGAFPKGTPPVIFASAIAGFFKNMGMGTQTINTTFTVISLAISAFALTSLDTATRLGRFMFQELMESKKSKEARLARETSMSGESNNTIKESNVRKVFGNMYVATGITIFFGSILCLGGYKNIWPLFGACNQLVAVPCFLAVSVWLAKQKRNNKMLFIPMIFMLVATVTTLILNIKGNITVLLSGEGVLAIHGLQTIIAIIILTLAMILVFEGMKVLKKANASNKVLDTPIA